MSDISINMEGYWLDARDMPHESGVYCVFECTYNHVTNKVTLHKLLYIGESEDVGSRIANHERKPDWEEQVQRGNALCFSFGYVTPILRKKAEAAMIYVHKPPCNYAHVHDFLYTKTTISLTGKTRLLKTSFVAVA